MHISYEERLGHPADFRVRYRFYKPDEGGRLKLPYQGIRSDCWYEHDGKDYFMIWPEFEDAEGNLILEDDCRVPENGTARMWIIAAERRPYHRERITVGMKCYFMEGKQTAECEVIEILALHTNPVKSPTR